MGVNTDIPLPEQMPEGWWAAILAEEEHQEQLPDAPEPETQDDKPVVNWDRADQIFRQDEIVTLNVEGFNRGGLLVAEGDLAGFVPCSHLVNLPVQMDATTREDCLSSYVGRTLKLKIIECSPSEGRMVLSERAARAEPGKRPELFSKLQPGQRVTGEVTNVTDFGVFVDLGGVEGLIHISELSWGRVIHPGQILGVGQQVEVLVMEVLADRCRVALSLKRLHPNPWEKAGERYPVNQVFQAVITSLVPYGAFARLEEGVEGLIHISEIPLAPNTTLKDTISPGQPVSVRIMQVDEAHQRLGLSLRINP